MADVTIDGSISTSTARGMRSVVFTTEDIGYQFYIDSSTSGFKYSKTTDGGATWGAGVLISPAVAGIAFDVWFDQWTPGDAGTLIHTWAFEATADDVVWRTLDTNGDTLGTARNVFVGSTAVAGRGTFVSGTKTTSGYLYCAYDIDAGSEKGFHRSTDGGTTWSSDLSTTFVEATIDQCLLFPAANTGDGNDCLALYHDASTNELTLKLWDSSGAAASESANITTLVENTTDLTGQYGFSASIRHSDGHIIAAVMDVFDDITGSLRVRNLNCTAPSTFTNAALTSITSGIDDHYYPQVFIDQTTDDIYVAYNGKRDGSETLGTTTKVYYTKSTDGGTTWSSGDTAYMEGSAGVVVQVWAPLMGPRFYAGWRVGTTLLGNKVNSLTFASGFSGTGSLAVAKAAIAASGLVAFIGTAALAVSVALSGTGTVTPPPVTGTGSFAVSAPALAGSGSVAQFSGTGSPAVSQPSISASGTNQQNVTGTGSLAVSRPALAGTGGQSNIGTGSLAVSRPSLAGSGGQLNTGTGSLAVGLPALSGSGTNQQNVTASGSLAVPAPSLAASGGQGDFRSGTAALAVPQPSLSATGTNQQQVSGTGSLAVSPSLSGSGTNQQQVSGSGSVGVPTPGLDSTGTNQQQVTGSVSLVVSAPSIAGTGAHQQQITGSGSLSVPPPTLAGNSGGSLTFSIQGGPVLTATLSGGRVLSARLSGGPTLTGGMSGGPV